MHLNQKNVNVVAVDSMKPCLLVQPVPKDVRTLRPRSYNEFSDDMESLKLSLSPCIGILCLYVSVSAQILVCVNRVVFQLLNSHICR